MSIHMLIKKIASTSDCRLFEADGLPTIDEKHQLPRDVSEFYEQCGGAVLFENADYPIYIVSPHEFKLANPIIVGELCEEDISSEWYIVCTDGKGEYLTIDLNEERKGKCYDSFFDRHGIVGETQVIASSFTDLVQRLLENKGKHWYWLRDDYISLGDAYDGVEIE
ncbi:MULTISPECIES: SMI1/KNR4 family protein [Bacillus amyloliquefaciens group]|uniref:SMI1/KNR4 family protein n=1 Tax=Bacillus amyloliquefaciens group TaxID=1938374 RepID=UPI0007A63975|nr:MULTISPECIES: SMI1/KNR4 family protein [Bacillus amyloliquefaciens group]RCX31506.1 SMI1/KNR4 family protein SUKH-1 [Bacillus amyloliquefaciens]